MKILRSVLLPAEVLLFQKNQIATERARVSAPPGYSEHSTGFAIDIGDFNKPKTDFDVKFEDTEISITASGGVPFSEESKSSSDLVNKADKRLYKAKKSGRNRFVLIDSEIVGE